MEAEIAIQPITPARVAGCYSVHVFDFEQFSYTRTSEVERHPAPLTSPLEVVRLDTVQLATVPPTFRAEVLRAGPTLKKRAENGALLPQVWHRFHPDTLNMWVARRDGSGFGLVVQPQGDSLIGFARVTSTEGAILAGEARAVLRPINCYTLGPLEPRMPGRRP